jgi:hypothetical protein
VRDVGYATSAKQSRENNDVKCSRFVKETTMLLPFVNAAWKFMISLFAEVGLKSEGSVHGSNRLISSGNENGHILLLIRTYANVPFICNILKRDVCHSTFTDGCARAQYFSKKRMDRRDLSNLGMGLSYF